jgi:ferrous iron transport protein B
MVQLDIKPDEKGFTAALDRLLTHKIWGFPIFFAFLWIMFVATFRLGAFPMHWIGTGVSSLSSFLMDSMAESMLKDLLIGGIISGIGGVIVFLPNILLLFFFISLMEESGYMARAVFIMDKIMHRIGLHGKSFIPMIMGFGCNVPAILATRTIENRDSRLITILINPFFSCSARLPVYVLLISAFFPDHSGTVLFLIYLIGIAIGVVTALVLKRTLFRSGHPSYENHLPAYRMPTMKRTMHTMWNNGLSYLKKISGVILIATIVIWALGYFPRNIHYSVDYEGQIAGLNRAYELELLRLDPGNTADIQSIKNNHLEEIRRLSLQQNAEKHEKSYIGHIGKWIEPALHPLGFDWKMGISLLTGISAKEIVVSTMGVLYQADHDPQGPSSATLIEKLHSQVYTSGPRAGQQVFTPLVAFGFMVFILIYFPCIGTIATISRVSGSWKWGAFTVIYSTLLAWVMALLIYQAGSLIF